MMVKVKKIWNSIFNFINKTNPFFIALILFLFFIVSGIVAMKFIVLGADMGELCNNPLRVLTGELPYRDFWLLFSPGEVYVPALIYKIFGINTDILINTFIIISALTAVFSFYVGKYLLKTNAAAFIFSLLFYFLSVISRYEGPGYNHLYLTFLLLSFFFITKHFNTNNLNHLFFAGLFAGIAFFFRVYEVGGAILGFTAALIIHNYFIKNELRISLKNLIIFILGIMVIPALTLLIFYNIAPKMLSEIVFESVKNGTSMNLPMFAYLQDFKPEFMADWNGLVEQGKIVLILKLLVKLSWLICAILQIILVWIGVLFLFLYIKTKPDKMELSITLILFLWSLFSYPKGLGRSSLSHFAPSTCPMALFICFATINVLRKKNISFGKLEKIITMSGTIVIIILLFSIMSSYSKQLNLRDKYIYTIPTERGTIRHKEKIYIDGIDSALKIIYRQTKPDDYIFVTPWDAPPFYVLTGRRNPTYYDSMNDLLVRPSDEKQRQLCKDLIEHNTKLIIHDPNTGYEPEQRFYVACKIIQEFIVKNYTFKGVYGKYLIYEKKDSLIIGDKIYRLN
ncbi:MAG: hypothetical protein HW421_3170 [Ignavibacteria bacterium]|nr:hypothetical protein [Ignavibacteria bacterium]